MFGPARRWRYMAALGLMLAAVPATAWGGETIWTKAAKLVCRIGELPNLVTPKQQLAEGPSTPLFAWETKDAVERGMTRGRCDEIVGDYQWAYYRYKAIARLYSSKQASSAMERLRGMKIAATDLFQDGCGAVTMQGLAVHCLDEGECWISDSERLARALPDRKDMLPETERTQVLVDLGVIAKQSELLALTPPSSGLKGWLGVGFFH